MTAKWQQWMPFYIDAFMGSPAVQAMHPSARIGYLCLLARAWQTDDCTIPSDDLILSEMSGIGDELWNTHKERILRKFEPVDGNGRLRNDVLFEKWKKAQSVYLKRAESADHTNTVRSPKRSSSGKDTVTVGKEDGDRSPTVYGRVYVDVPVSVPVSLPEKPVDACMFASAVLLECRIGGRDLRMVLEEIGRAEAAHGEDLEALAEQASRAWVEYCAAKPMLEYAWGALKFFGEGYWKTPETWPRIGAKPTAKEIAWKKFEERTRDADEAE